VESPFFTIKEAASWLRVSVGEVYTLRDKGLLVVHRHGEKRGFVIHVDELIRRLLNHSSLSATKKYIHKTDDRLVAIGSQIGRSFPNSFPMGEKEALCLPEGEVPNVH
jgi:hypothetical protein